jgi:hypothetical protein
MARETRAVIRYDGEHYRVHHNRLRLSGQYSIDAAREIRDAIMSGKRTGCPCPTCRALRERD